MAKIQIDGAQYEVKPEKNLLENCLALGFDIPYFCFHPAMGSVGACRLCAVKKFANPDDKRGRIVMSCMEPVVEGMIISTDDPDVKAFRESVLEGLMANHPHDCPVCDEGGECHLQDMTVMTGHNYRRYKFKKRTHTNQYLGPYIKHEMNRCIQCYRCVRFYRNYAGGKDLNVFGSGSNVYFGRQQDGALESEFSGNLVEVCPTGVFTDKTFNKHFARKWDLSNTPSICQGCSLGCNIIVSERYGTVRRVMSRYNGSVNGYFICDRGRFGYEFINHADRIRKVHLRATKTSELLEVEGSLTLTQAPGKKVIGIGSPRASMEANFALLDLVGKENFSHGISGAEHQLVKKAVRILKDGIYHTPTLKEIEKCDAILVLGADIPETAPMLALAIRQAARTRSIALADQLGIPEWNDYAVRELDQTGKGNVFIASPSITRLDELAEVVWHSPLLDIARLGFAVASYIDPGAPLVSVTDDHLREAAEKIAAALMAAENPLIITGIVQGTDDLLNACSNIAVALSNRGKRPSVSIIFPEANSVGLAMLDGLSLEETDEKTEDGRQETRDKETRDGETIDTVIILENDLYARASKEKVDSLLKRCRQVIVIDHTQNDTTRQADILLPSATFAEAAGTIVSNEGRAQRFYAALPEKEPVKAGWRWCNDSWKNLDQVVDALVKAYPEFSAISSKIPDAGFRCFDEKVARQTMRYSGRTAMNAKIAVSEPKPPQDVDSPMSFSMEGYKGTPPASLIPYYWSPGWNSLQASNKYLDEPGGHVRNGGDPGIRLFDDDNGLSLEYVQPVLAVFNKKEQK